MGFRKAMKQWKMRVHYHVIQGLYLGAAKHVEGYSKPPSLFYAPGAENTGYEYIQSSEGIKIRVPTEFHPTDEDKVSAVYTPKPQRRWNIFVNFILSPIEILSWAVILVWQTGKFIFQTLLWNAARHVVGPLVLSMLGVTIIPIFQSIKKSVKGFYKRLGRDQNVELKVEELRHTKEEAPSGFLGWFTFIFFYLPLGIVVGAVRGVMRTLMMLVSRVDADLEKAVEDGFDTTIKSTSWMMLPKLFTAIGDWFEAIANHLNNFVRLMIGDTSIGSILQETISFIFNLPAVGLKCLEAAVLVVGVVLALAADLFIFWSWAGKDGGTPNRSGADIVTRQKSLSGHWWVRELLWLLVAVLREIFSGKSEPQPEAQGEVSAAAVATSFYSTEMDSATTERSSPQPFPTPTPAYAGAASVPGSQGPSSSIPAGAGTGGEPSSQRRVTISPSSTSSFSNEMTSAAAAMGVVGMHHQFPFHHGPSSHQPGMQHHLPFHHGPSSHQPDMHHHHTGITGAEHAVCIVS